MGLALLARDRGELPIPAQFLMYPTFDDRTGTPFEPEQPLPDTGEFIWTKQSNYFAWTAVLGHAPETPDVPIYAAPGRAHHLTGLPPTTVCIGELDLFLAENLRFVRNLIRDGGSVEFHIYPGAYHGFASFGQEADVSKRAVDDLCKAMMLSRSFYLQRS